MLSSVLHASSLTVRLQGGDQQVPALSPDGVGGDGGRGEGDGAEGGGGRGGGLWELLRGLGAVEERTQWSRG